MEYKLSKPEDFTDVEEFSFKLSNAYSKVYSDLLTLLVYVDTAVENLREDSGEVMLEASLNLLEKHIAQFK